MRALGIDLGTYNSSGAMAVGGGAKIVMVESANGRARNAGKRFPSFVGFNHDGCCVDVGELARRNWPVKPDLVVWGVKRMVGLSYREAEEKHELSRFQYRVLPSSKDGSIRIEVGKTEYSPQDILKILLKTIKQDAENPVANPATGGLPIEAVVISVPAYFTTWRVSAICEAASAAGFKTVSTITEPTAAALQYGLAHRDELSRKPKTILTYDLGAGTLDVTVLKLHFASGRLQAEELSVAGDAALGGLDMDGILHARLAGLHKVPDEPAMQCEFRPEVENAKVRLSSHSTTYLNLPMGGEADITRAQIESYLVPAFEARLLAPIDAALARAGMKSARGIDYVLFVGGPTQMPFVRKLVAERLRQREAETHVLSQIMGNAPNQGVNVMDCVSQGAALAAAGHVISPPPIIAEGYGTECIGRTYAEAIPPNRRCPADDQSIVSGELTLTYSDPNLRRVPFDLVAKIPNPVMGQAGVDDYHYLHVGNLGLAIEPTGEKPTIVVTTAIDRSRRLQITLKHQQSGSTATYHALDRLSGRVLPLSVTGTPPGQNSATPYVARVHWTPERLERTAVEMRGVFDRLLSGKTAGNKAVQESREAFDAALRQAKVDKDPQKISNVWNLAQGTVSRLNPEVLDDAAYHVVKAALDGIASA